MTPPDSNPHETASHGSLLPAVPSVDEIPAYIKPRYQRLALVSSPEHLTRLDPADENTLIVTTDWLMWCRGIEQRIHCLHYETGLVDWTGRGAPVDDFMLRVADSIFSNGSDVTLFEGVSVGSVLQGEIAHMGRFFLRAEAALSWFFRRFQPAEIVLYGFAYEKRQVSASGVSKLVSLIAEAQGVSFFDRSHPDETLDQDSRNLGRVRPVPSTTLLKKILLMGYITGVTAACRLRNSLTADKPKILLQPTGDMVRPLLEAFDGRGMTPVLFARQMPKGPGVVLRCLWKGVLLVRFPSQTIDAAVRGEAEAMIDKIGEAWENDGGERHGLTAFVRHFVRERLMGRERFHHVIAQVKGFKEFIRRQGIRRVTVSGFLNPQAMILLQLARKDGLPTDDILHGMRVSHQKFPQICGDGDNAKPVVNRLLAWGEQNRDWLKGAHARCEAVITGYPALTSMPQAGAAVASGGRRALVLPFEIDRDNIIGLHANTHAALIGAVRVLADKGYDVTVKVHPGLAPEPYRNIAKHFQLPCRVVQDGDFTHHASRADIVIGPMNTSAMIQCLSFGKPYYPFSVRPTIDDPTYLLGCTPSSSGAELRRALETGDALDRDAMLQYFCSSDEIGDPARRFWEVLGGETKSLG